MAVLAGLVLDQELLSWTFSRFINPWMQFLPYIVSENIGRRDLDCFCAALIVFNAERINNLAAQHYKSFTDQPYFDRHGIFFSAIVSAPLLFSMFILLVSFAPKFCPPLCYLHCLRLYYHCHWYFRYWMLYNIKRLSPTPLKEQIRCPLQAVYPSFCWIVYRKDLSLVFCSLCQFSFVIFFPMAHST